MQTVSYFVKKLENECGSDYGFELILFPETVISIDEITVMEEVSDFMPSHLIDDIVNDRPSRRWGWNIDEQDFRDEADGVWSQRRVTHCHSFVEAVRRYFLD